MPQIPEFPSSDDESKSDDGRDRNRSIIGRILDDDGFPSATPG